MLFSIFIFITIVSFSTIITNSSAQTTPSFISTRDHFDRTTGDLKPQNNPTSYKLTGTIPGLNSECTDEFLYIFMGFGQDHLFFSDTFI